MCAFVHEEKPLSPTHSQAGWQSIGKVTFPFAALPLKIACHSLVDYIVTNTETSRSRGSIRPRQEETPRDGGVIERGEMEKRRGQDNPAAIVSEEKQSKEVEKVK